MRSLLRVSLLVVLLGLVWVARASADGPVGTDPAQNFVSGPMPLACESAPDGAVCQNAAIYYLDQARASLGQPAYELPADFTSLPVDARDLILTDLDRVMYGLPPIPGVTAALDADAGRGVTADGDPTSSDPNFTYATSNWAGAFDDIDQAYLFWMYDDGPGSGNIDCTPTHPTGCWGHRHDVLWSFGGSGALAMGAASGTDPSGSAGYAMLLGMGNAAYVPSFTYTWAAAQADGAGSSPYSPGVPQATVDVNVAGGGVVSDGHGQSCTSGMCAFSEPVGQAVTLTATPASGFGAVQWSGSCPATGPCAFTPSQTITYAYAYFAPTLVSSGPITTGSGGTSGAPTGTSGSHGTTGSGGTTGTTRLTLHATSGRATIRVVLAGTAHAVYTLERHGAHGWVALRTIRGSDRATFGHLRPGRYRVIARSGARTITRVVTLR